MKKPFVIGIDGRFFATAGPGRYTKAIVEHLEKIDKKNEYIVFLREDNFSDYKPKNKRFKKVLAEYPWYSWSEQFGFLLKIIRSNLDLLYVPHFNIPVLYPKKIVTAIPDIIMHTYSTDEATTLFRPYFKFKKIIYKLVVFWALLRTKKNIVPSHDVLNDLVKHYPLIPRKKHIVAYEGVDPVLMKSNIDTKTLFEEFGITENFLLYVSSMYSHKNVERLVDAFESLIKEKKYSGQLVLVGKKDHYSKKLYEYIKNKNLSTRVVVPGLKRFIIDGEVVALRKKADLYVFPSLKEGFSLTPLEAQVLGVPCVISNIPCHKEIYGNSVLYFDPLDTRDISNKIDQLLGDKKLQRELITRGEKNARKYSWTETAKITLKVFEQSL